MIRLETDARGQAGELRAVIAALVRRFALSERADVLCCGLTVAQAAALEALHGGEPVRLGPLARRLGITPSTLTRNLARLETDGLVTRDADPEDARAARVRLTAAGERASAKVEQQELAFAEDILARLGRARRPEVMRALSELLRAVRDATEECCPGAFDHLMGDLAETAGRRRRDREQGNCCD
jgi:DNA-binding MarR family transcriptional regulator